MTLETLGLLGLAGVAAGLVGTVTGLASLVSYPALIAAGLAPVAANVTNTVSLVGIGVGGIQGSRPELRGQRDRVLRLAVPAVLGGVAGGSLLLFTPSAAFAKVVPWLIGLGSIAVLVRPRPAPLPGGDSETAGVPHPSAPEPVRRHDRWLWIGTFFVSVYGGYFGAAAGVLMIGLLLLLTGDNLARVSATRTVLLFLANGIAAVYFGLFGPVHWTAAISMGAGTMIGGRLGPMVLRRSPDRPLRVLIAAVGLGLAIRYGFEAYR